MEEIVLQEDQFQQNPSNFILEKKKDFDFVIPKIRLNWNDNLELREKILNMTSDEREQLGINKSILWYIKKNLSEGKIPKIYQKWDWKNWIGPSNLMKNGENPFFIIAFWLPDLVIAIFGITQQITHIVM